MKIAYFFGAGASVYFEMPTTEKMLDFFTEKDPKFAKLHEYIKFQDMESVYTYLQDLKNPLFPLFMINGSKQTGIDLSREITKYFSELKEWRKIFKNDIRNYLVKYLDPTQQTIDHYTSFLEKLQKINPEHKLKIITTNYDLLLDRSFNGNWIDGFKPTEGYTTKRWQNKWDDDPSKHTLVKLHGSINWEYSEGSRKYKERYIVKHQKAIKNPMIIPLTSKKKDYRSEPYSGMINRFNQIIVDVDLLVVIGYTFRDQEIRDIIYEHTEKNLHVLLLSPNADKTATEKFKKINRLTISKTDGNIYCDNINNSQVYYCNKKFESDTINDVVKLIKRMSKIIDADESIPSDPNT